MTRRLPLLLLVLLGTGRGLGAAEPGAAGLAQRVQARYDATEDFTANVIQEMTVASLGKTIRSEGTVAFKKPGKMRWEFPGDAAQTIVADGTTLWLYQPAEKQVLKAPFQAAFSSSTPISFLAGVGRISEDFDVSVAGDATGPVADDVVDLLLVSKRDADNVGRLRLTVVRDSGDIRAAAITDPLGNVTRLEFSNMQRNVHLGAERFVFEVPPGVDVITAPIGQ